MYPIAAWSSEDEEAANLRTAAARSGCRVRTLRVVPTSTGPRVAGVVDCPDGWAAARMLLAAAIEDSQTAGARDLALELRNGRSDAEFARAVFAFVRENVAFVREAGEVFTGASYTIATGAGDCDDHARVTYALLRAGGVPARMAFLYRTLAAGPSHVLTEAGLGGVWVPLETTIAAKFGEPPTVAARRLGLIDDRTDITNGVLHMTERDLSPAFLRDALEALGHICGPREPSRDDVRAFQAAHGGLAVDGLYGPKTHAALVAALHAEGMGELAARGMGAPAAGNALTPDLSAGFFRGVAAMAERMREKGAGIDGDDLLAVWNAESGVRAAIKNGAGAPYYGLNQMGIEQMRAAGFSGDAAAYMALGAEGQLPYVERYYTNATGGRLNLLQDSADLYVANFLPAFLPQASRDPAFVLTSQANDPHGWYRWNTGLDVDKDGTITKADLKRAIGRAQQSDRWLEIRRRFHAESGAPPGSGAAVVLGVLLAMGAAAWWVTRA
jgi:hypothetical protein